MVFRATPLLLLLSALAAGTPPLHAQSAALADGCTREKVKPPSPQKPKEERLSAARVRVREGARELVARRAAGAGISEPKGVFVLRAEKNRSKVALAGARTNLPAPLLEAIAAESAELFADWPEKGAVSVSVRLDSLPIPEVPVGTERTYCRPRSLNPAEIITALEHQLQVWPEANLQRGYRTRVRFLLTRDGEILAPELSAHSGNSLWDQAALNAVRQLHMTPAHVDGIAYDAWASMPIVMKGRGK